MDSVQAWGAIREIVDHIESSQLNGDGGFEVFCEQFWSMVTDESLMEEMSKQGYKSYYDLFKDEELKRLSQIPLVKAKIDLNSYQNQNRFWHLMWWHHELPELHLPSQQSLTKLTQRNGAIGQMKELLRTDLSKEDKEDKAKDILFGEIEKKEDVPHVVQVEDNVIWIDSKPALRLSKEDYYALRLKSKTLTLKDRWLISVPHATLMLCKESGMEEYGRLLTEDVKILEYLASKGIKIEMSS